MQRQLPAGNRHVDAVKCDVTSNTRVLALDHDDVATQGCEMASQGCVIRSSTRDAMMGWREAPIVAREVRSRCGSIAMSH